MRLLQQDVGRFHGDPLRSKNQDSVCDNAQFPSLLGIGWAEMGG
jgi:hypothetical protein